MIIDTVTVTTTPTTIHDLLETAGRTLTGTEDVDSMSFRLPEASLDIVYASDKETITPVILLDPANAQPYASHLDTNLHQTLLSVLSGTSDVGVIISQ